MLVSFPGSQSSASGSQKWVHASNIPTFSQVFWWCGVNKCVCILFDLLYSINLISTIVRTSRKSGIWPTAQSWELILDQMSSRSSPSEKRLRLCFRDILWSSNPTQHEEAVLRNVVCCEGVLFLSKYYTTSQLCKCVRIRSLAFLCHLIDWKLGQRNSCWQTISTCYKTMAPQSVT